MILNQPIGPSGVSGLVWPPNGISTLDFVLDSLRRLSPLTLRELIEEPDAAMWAARHGLECALVVRYLERLQQFWTHRPDLAARLVFGGTHYLSASSDGPAEQQWVGENLDEANLPDPSSESLETWLHRAGALYRGRLEAEQVDGVKPRPRARWDEFARQCDWFVYRQVLCQSAKKISQTERCDHAAVVRATRRIATLLAVQPRWRTTQRVGD